MATVTMVAVERSGPAIRPALAEYAPDEPRFTAELRDALARAGRECRALQLGVGSCLDGCSPHR